MNRVFDNLYNEVKTWQSSKNLFNKVVDDSLERDKKLKKMKIEVGLEKDKGERIRKRS